MSQRLYSYGNKRRKQDKKEIGRNKPIEIIPDGKNNWSKNSSWRNVSQERKEQEKDNYVGERLYPKVDEAGKFTELLARKYPVIKTNKLTPILPPVESSWSK